MAAASSPFSPDFEPGGERRPVLRVAKANTPELGLPEAPADAVDLERQRFEQTFETLYVQLVAFAQSYLRDYDAAQDVVADVVLRVLARFGTGWRIDEPERYLRRAVKMEVKTWRRTERIHGAAKDSIQAGDYYQAPIPRSIAADERTDLTDLQRRVQLALKKLRPQQRLAFVLMRVEQRPIEQAASMMGLAERTVRQHLAAAFDLLDAELAD
jgi:RNA polymerase sigma factor (sigma-70 family)